MLAKVKIPPRELKPQYNVQWALDDEQLKYLIKYLDAVRKDNLKNGKRDSCIHVFELELVDNQFSDFDQLNQDFVVINFDSHGCLFEK